MDDNVQYATKNEKRKQLITKMSQKKMETIIGYKMAFFHLSF